MLNSSDYAKNYASTIGKSLRVALYRAGPANPPVLQTNRDFLISRHGLPSHDILLNLVQ